MSFFSMLTSRKIKSRGAYNKKIFLVLILTLFILFNFIYLTNISSQIRISNDIEQFIDEKDDEIVIENLQSATDTSMLESPFTTNMDLLLNFFEVNYKSSLNNNFSTYFRFGDTAGIITDDTIYSEDNLLIYKSMMNSELSESETFDTYLKLKSTPLWNEGVGQFMYGFVKSVENSTGQKNSNRYLVDNLLPIFLLIEKIGENIDGFSINGEYPRDSIEEMFFLVNSSQFWDDINKGFYNHNSTSNKYSESNFYGIMGNLLIRRIYNQLDLDATIEDRAFYLANQTMNSLDNFMWDSSDKAFYHDADASWDTSSPGQKYYHLTTNAIGIMALLEFWIETGMENDSSYLLRALELYNSLDDNLWSSINNAYYTIAQPSWIPFDSSFNLKANSLMMSACLKLFEFTGNISYYNRAVEIFNSFENNFYDGANEAYDYSLTNSSKNLNSNLVLSEAYLKAFDIYSSTVINSEYNVTSEIPNFVFNQDIMNLTSVYSFNKIVPFYNSTTESYGSNTIVYNISTADINYLLKYPNGTFLNQFENQIIDPATSHTLVYSIDDLLPLGDNYLIYVWSNTTYFSVAETLKHFNVTSGLIDNPVEGLVNILYQGPNVNISLPVNYTRSGNLTLTTSLSGENIINYPSRDVNFTSGERVIVPFNLTARFGATPGPSEIIFRITQGNILYLEVKEIIEIGYSFDYTNLIHEGKVVSGDNLYVSLSVINFLPNATQSLNISFEGLVENTIEDFIQEEILEENEIISVSYYLKTFANIKNDTLAVKMKILQNETVYYTEEFVVDIIQRYEVLSVSFPNKIPQGVSAYLIISILNNGESAEPFSLFLNGKEIQTNIEMLLPGENRIMISVVPSNNPYEFGTKNYRIIIEDNEDIEIARLYFAISLELSPMNLVLFYLLPGIIPIGIVLFFINKELKHKKLRR
ncbi:MAG: hypothetical protein ACXAC2_12355, partial [Candidatus Kariarchaeaceae archaeon]